MDVGAAFVAHAQTAEAIKPGKGAFDHPAVAAQALAAILSTAGDASLDAACTQGSTAASVVVALVGVQLFGPAAWAASWTSVGQHRIKSFLQHLGVVHVGGREHRGQGLTRRALPPGGASCPRGRDRPDSDRLFRPLLRGDRTRVHGRSAPVQPGGVGQTLEQDLVPQVPHTGLVPVAQPSPARHARAAAHPGRQQLPRRAGTQHEHRCLPTPHDLGCAACRHAYAAARAARVARLLATTRHLPAAWPWAQPTRKPSFVRCSK